MVFRKTLSDRVFSDDQATQLQAKCNVQRIQYNLWLERQCCMYIVSSLAIMSLGIYEYDQKM